MSDFITPTVGRVVWFYPSGLTGEGGFASPPEGQPLAAMITRVWNDRMVNLVVFDANGAPHPRTSVPLVQEDQITPRGFYCTWMPFQKGQARAQAAVQAANSVASDACKALNSEPAVTPLAVNQRVNDALKAATMAVASQRPSRRDELECSLVSGAAHALAGNPNNAKDLAEGIKDFLNVLHPVAAPANPQAGVLYPAIRSAMEELAALHPGFNDHVNRAWNYLHRAFWSEVPVPASAPGLRDTLAPEEKRIDMSPTKQQDASAGLIQVEGVTAPRVSQGDVEDEIVKSTYFVFPDTTLTVCCIHLRNGFPVVGESACVSRKIFDPARGRELAYEDAKRKIWPLMGYALKQRLHDAR